ncbi:hypothetical protein AX17_001497 [Amanita inopinata Kibby_2008]|nr:hypothetical protein AX17_001497 [Amanita inopinata Kibby_2008]
MPKVLVANRGEIAIRILRAAIELEWDTVAIYTEGDPSHAAFSDEIVKLNGVQDYMDPNVIVQMALKTGCTHIHPGYGFLSENPILATETLKSSLTFIGPSPGTLRIASDKLLSRELATSLGVPVAPGRQINSATDVKDFAQTVGYPIMIKALDGGGGRGIRLVDLDENLDEAYKRCLGESPSRRVFVEKALLGRGWKHVEVQVIGDGSGAVNHLWERECSVQRRFQKIIEIAPSHVPRSAVQPLLDASLKLASQLKYRGLGTFEYLVNIETLEWVFLEINPRVQVEHTVTEEIVNIDLVRAQLLLSVPGATLSSLGLQNPLPIPNSHVIQLRLTAEDPTLGFRLSHGTLHASEISWPAGRGVRVDTWLTSGPHGDSKGEWIVGTDFDSLLAKVIVSGNSFEEATQKGIRALMETKVGGAVRTNVELLVGVLKHLAWGGGNVDTLWLERNLEDTLATGKRALLSGGRKSSQFSVKAGPPSSPGGVMLQPGSTFQLTLSPQKVSSEQQKKYTFTFTTIAHNALPVKLSGTLQSSISAEPFSFSLAQTSSVGFSSSSLELADPNNPSHVASPLTGKIVELHSHLCGAQDSGGGRVIRRGETLVVISVMKMENVIVSPYDAAVDRTGKGVEIGALLSEGALICVLSRTSKL